jgi:hypothetical protein
LQKAESYDGGGAGNIVDEVAVSVTVSIIMIVWTRYLVDFKSAKRGNKLYIDSN